MFRLLFAFSLLFCSPLTGQNNLSGTLVDDRSGEPIAFATVYLDGTSKGEVTGDDGSFSLSDVTLPATLVVSHLSYENLALAIEAIGEPLALRLKARETTIQGVEITDRNNRAENLAEFRDLLIGKDEWGKKARLENDEVLRFDRDYTERTLMVRNEKMREMLRKRNRPSARWSEDGTTYTYEKRKNLKAVSTSPLEIDLPHLGYTLKMDLQSFLADYEAGRRAYLGTFFFTDVAKLKKSHLKNRQQAYLGSVMHFVRSLVAGALATNGFSVVEMIKKPGVRDDELRDIDLTEYVHQVNESTWALRGLKGRRFTILYHADSKQRPLPPWKWKRSQPVQASFIVEAESCIMRKGGALGDANLAFYGYMGDRGLAWALPSDYEFVED